MNRSMLDSIMSVVLINNLSSAMPRQSAGPANNIPAANSRRVSNLSQSNSGSLLLPANPELGFRVPPPSPVVQPVLNNNSLASQILPTASAPDQSIPSFGIPDLSPDTLRQIAWMDGNPNDVTLYDINMYMNGQLA